MLLAFMKRRRAERRAEIEETDIGGCGKREVESERRGAKNRAG